MCVPRRPYEATAMPGLVVEFHCPCTMCREKKLKSYLAINSIEAKIKFWYSLGKDLLE